MSAQTNDSSGLTQRKSSRPRQKRSLGDDFIDPTSVSLRMNNQPPNKKKTKSRSPTLLQAPEDSTDGTEALRHLIEHIKDEPVDEGEVVTTRRKSGRQVKPTLKMKLAEKEVKQELREADEEAKPESLICSSASSNSVPPETVFEEQSLSPPPNQAKQQFVKQQPSTKFLTEEQEEEEKRLHDAAMSNVAAICAANVQKILAKRTLGRFSTGSQQIAQNREISRFVAANNGDSVGSNPKFVTLANKTIAVPPNRKPNLKATNSRPLPLPARPLPHVRPTNVPYRPQRNYFPVMERAETDEKKPNQLLTRSTPLYPVKSLDPRSQIPQRPKSFDPLSKYVTVSDQSYQVSRHGGSPSLVRTVTVMPQRSMHLDADGNPPGPSNRIPPPPQSQYNTIRTVIARGPDGKPLPIRRFIYPNPSIPCVLPKPASAVRIETDNGPPPLMDRHNNLVTVKPIKVNSKYETLFSPSQQVNYHPNQPQFLYPVATKPRVPDFKETSDIKEIKQEPKEQQEGKVANADLNGVRKMVLVARSEESKSILFPEEKEDMLMGDDYYDDEDYGERSDSYEKESSDMVWLGAEEPMKDLDEDKYRFRRYELKTVEKFTSRHLRPFGKRPPGKADIFMEPGAFGLSAVLLAETDEEEYEKKIKQWRNEEDAEKRKDLKKYEEEKLRQQRARAQKLTTNPLRICHYMQSDAFMRTRKPESEMTTFEKIMFDSETLNKFNESLSATNPKLLENLQRIRGPKKFGKKSHNNLFPLRNLKKKDVPARLSGPIRLEEPLPPLDHSHKSYFKDDNLPKGPPKKLKVMWNGMVREVPEWIPCHLCRDLMRLCMRKSNYRGELREYPAYRCLRKGCQTFRSIKKIIRDPHEPPQNFARKPYAAESPDRVLSRSVGQYLNTERKARVRKSKLDALSKDYVCSGSVEDVVKEEYDEYQDEEEEEDEDELVEWTAYPGSSTVAAAEELRDAILNCRSAASDKQKLEQDPKEENLEDYEYNPYHDDDEQTPIDEPAEHDGLMEVKQEIIEEDETEMIEQKPDINNLLETKGVSLTLHTPSF